MHMHMTFTAKCLQLTLLSTLVTARIIPIYPAPSTAKNDDSNQLGLSTAQIPQTDSKWQFQNLNAQSSSEVEKLVKSLEHIFKNEDLSNSGANAGGFGLKILPGKEIKTLDFTGEKNLDHNVDLSSPHVLRIPVPQPYPVHIPVKEPFTVPIFKLVPEEVEKKVPIPVEKLVPVYKEKPVKVIVEKHHPFPVYKPYVIPVPVNTHILVGKKKEAVKWYHDSFY